MLGESLLILVHHPGQVSVIEMNVTVTIALDGLVL